jgi:alpha-glucoside transport system permease protein
MSERREVLVELPVRPDTRAPVPGRRPVPWRAVAHLAPAAAVVTAVLVVPLAFTVWTSLRYDHGWRNYLDVWAEGRVRHAIWNNAKWIVFSLVVLLLGVSLALLGRRIGRSRAFFFGVIVAPLAVSAAVTGMAFRLLFDPLPERGPVAAVLAAASPWLHRHGSPRPQSVGALDSDGIAWVLGSAFAWSWIGLTVVVLRAGLAGTRPELVRLARAFGSGRLRAQWTALVPALVPVLPVVLLTVSVAAIRVFDVVLVTAPGSTQNDAEVVGLLWWRWKAVLGPGRSAALAVLLLLAVAVAALLALGLLARTWPVGASVGRVAGARRAPDLPADVPTDLPTDVPAGVPLPAGVSAARATVRRRRRWPWWGLGAAVGAFWLIPLGMLALTSLRSPTDAAESGWWHGHGLGLGSYRAAFAGGGLLGAVWSTLQRGVLAALLTLCFAVPAAWALARGGLSQRASRWLLRVGVVVAVIPVQAVAGPLGSGLDRLRLSNTDLGLVVVHLAFGIPFAVLVLRAAFAARRPPVPAPFAPPGAAWLLALVDEVVGSWSAVLAVGVLEFLLVWNDLVVGLLLGGSESKVVTLAVLGQGRQFAASSGPLAAAAVISVLVPFLLVLATGRRLVRGLSAGVVR